MLKRKLAKILSICLSVSVVIQGVVLPTSVVHAEDKISLTMEDLDDALAEGATSFNRVAVHDPSVVEATTDEGKMYYIFGSHMAVAKSSDLMDWEQVSKTENDKTSSLFGVVDNGSVKQASFLEAFTDNAFKGTVPTTVSDNGVSDFGTYNAATFATSSDSTANISGNMWAPDVIFNKSLKKWCMYLSLNGNGNSQHSVIILLTADDVEGPYVYQGPVVYSRVDDNPMSKNYWKNTDMPLVYGDLETMPARYENTSSGDFANYHPHAIDPGVFYDEDGNLWMVYGSWSGGIYMLELDETTGLRDYTVSYKDETCNAGKGNGVEDLTSTKESIGKDIMADPYFGKKVAGGYYVSGEGPYIQYIDGKYYLFMSYGDYAPNGNYQMRIFSSSNPDGPYVDTKGTSAIYNSFSVNYNSTYCNIGGKSDMGADSDSRGSRLMTNYKWSTMDKAEMSQGHNSVITTEDGSFVIYHTKLDDGTSVHEVRVHQLFTVDGALIAAPYEYDSSVTNKSSYSTEEATNSYEVIFQNFDTNKRYDETTKAAATDTNGLKSESPVSFEFHEDGKIVFGSDEIGTWSVNDNDAEITFNESYSQGKYTGTYKGYFVEQMVDGKQKTCFTAINATTGLSVWGTASVGDVEAIALTNKNQKMNIPAKTKKDIVLPTEGLSGCTIEWSSSNQDVIQNNGKVAEVSEDTQVTLTRTISRGNYYYSSDYVVTVTATKSETKSNSIELTSNDFFESMDNPFYNQTLDKLYIRYTINYAGNAVKTGWDGLFSFYKDSTKGRVSIQSAPYMCFNECKEGGKWLDINHCDTAVNKALNAVAGEDYTYEIIIESDSIRMFEDGVEFTPSKNGTSTGQDVLDYISKECDKFSFGVGKGTTSFWWTELCTLSNILITDAVPVDKTYEEYTSVDGTTPESVANPLYGTEVKDVELEYVVNFADNARMWGFESLFSFYDTSTVGSAKGRISIHTAPYICYNELGNDMWMDINHPESASSVPVRTLEKGKDYTYKITINEEEVNMYLDDNLIENIKCNRENANLEDLLTYITKCDKIALGGETGVNCYWEAENATVKSLKISSNKAQTSAIFTPEKDPEPQVKADFDMSNVKWSAQSFVYDGKEKTVVLENVPEGIEVEYEGNVATNVGEYVAKATFSYDTEKYNAPTAVADLNWSIAELAKDPEKEPEKTPEKEPEKGTEGSTQKATPTLNLTKTSYKVKYGDKAFSLNANANKDCKITYTSKDKNVVTVSTAGKVTIKGIGKTTVEVKVTGDNYETITKDVTIRVSPKTMALSSAKRLSKTSIKVTWKKDKNVTGYQVQYSTNKNFTKSKTKTVTIKSNKTLNKTIKKLKSGKKYYVRIRSYKTVNKVKYYSAYSKAKTVK